jgi:hypothetical protein
VIVMEARPNFTVRKQYTPERSECRARQLVERYNGEADRLERLRQRISELEQTHRETYKAAFAALPDGATIAAGRGHMEYYPPAVEV